MLTPTHTNAIVLYGQDACTRYESMIDYWATILEPAAWNQFLFVLVSDGKPREPKVPRDVEDTLRRNSWIIRTDCTTCPANITDAIRQRLTGGRALLQCVFSDFVTHQADPLNAVRLMDDIVQAFPQGVVETIYYLTLHTDAQATVAQRTMMEELNKHQHAHVYLLSDMADDASTIDNAILWRAVFGEMLANSAQRRALMNGRLYSLGYSSLNANDSELRNLRCQKVFEVVRRKAGQDITSAEAWRIITQSNNVLGDTDPYSLRGKVEQWVKYVASQEITLPNETERLNNRILSNVYQLDLNMSAIASAIERFYLLNGGIAESAQETRRRLKEKHLSKMRGTLCGMINAATFPVGLVDRLIELLGDMERMTPRSENRKPPKRKLMMSAADYCDACCEVFESNCAAAAPARVFGLCAGALRETLEAMRAFLTATKGVAEIISEQVLTTDQLGYLTQKYPKYWATVQDTEHDQGEKLYGAVWVSAHAPYFTESGMPIADQWQGLINDGENLLQNSMAAQFPRSFCDVVNQECPTATTLSDFFNSYLTDSRRMIHNIADTRTGPQMLYYADRTFANHPWIVSKNNDCETARNDNVERLDFYTLAHSLSWYLGDQDNYYLNAKTRLDICEKDAPSLWATRVYMPDAREMELKTQSGASEDQSHGLTLHADGQHYTLSWTWMPHTSTAVVTLAQEGREPFTIPCSDSEFARDQGLDVSNCLTYGKVAVSVYVGGRRYAYREMAGRRDLVRYRLERAAEGTSTLTLKGKVTELRKLVLCVRKRNEGSSLLYPINAVRPDEAHRFTGLRLPSGEDISVIPSPEEPYPTVQALKI